MFDQSPGSGNAATATSKTTWAALGRAVEMLKRLGPPPASFTIWCHPESLKALRGVAVEPDIRDVLRWHVDGTPVHTSPYLPRWCKRWEFPRTPFVEYEKTDERWAIPLGLGRWVDDTTRPAFYRVADQALSRAPIRLSMEPYELPGGFRSRFLWSSAI